MEFSPVQFYCMDFSLPLILIIDLTKADVLIFSELCPEEMVNSVFGESEERGSGEGKAEGEVKVCGAGVGAEGETSRQREGEG